MIEMLVVLIIISILSAMIVPAFLGQRDKARDSRAKEQLVTARTAIEVYGVDRDGSYFGATPATLEEIESVLAEMPITVVSATKRTYELQVTSETGSTFDLERMAGGLSVRSCAPAGAGGCGADGTW